MCREAEVRPIGPRETDARRAHDTRADLAAKLRALIAS